MNNQEGNKANLLMFTKDNCPYCEKAKLLLNSKQIPYVWVNLNENPQDITDMIKSLGIKTVPAIFEYKGGYDELAASFNIKEGGSDV